MFAAGIRLNSQQVTQLNEEVKVRAATVKGTLDVLADEKGTAIILDIKM